jgi:sialate O-acetylesterase
MQRLNHLNCFAAAALALVSSQSLFAEVKLPAIIGDNMVLQRGVEVPLWGWADANEKVTAKLGDKSSDATAGPDGKWKLKLPAQEASDKPVEITVTGAAGKAITLKNILIGDVWVCSGQSNMEYGLGGADHGAEDTAAATNPMIRLFYLEKATSPAAPLEDCKGAWAVCSPQAAGRFSAVGYHFGRELQEKMKIPIGLINSNWGGTPAESWASMQSLEAEPSLVPMAKSVAGQVEAAKQAQAKYEQKVKEYEQAVKDYPEAVKKAKDDDKPEPNRPIAPKSPGGQGGNPNVASTLYNGMIAPIVNFPITGAVWYQGESNVGRGYEYRTLFPTMIKSWRTSWGNPDLRFYFVQIAPYNYNKNGDGVPCAELWDAQSFTMKTLPHTGMAVINDVGNVADIHPRNKRDPGHRLALWALYDTYGQKDLVHSGPIYKEAKIEGDKVRVSFDSVGGGLVTRDGKELNWFTVAGEDQKFVPAKAEVDGQTIVVHADGVTKPVAVRFAYHEAAEPNLMNKEGLPASPFRTDDFKMQSQH